MDGPGQHADGADSLSTVKPKTLIAASCAACLLVLLTPRVVSQDEPGAAGHLAREQALLLSAPGPEHRLLARLAGDWRVDTSFHGTGADEPPAVQGEARGELVAGGRFVLLTVRSGSTERVTLLGFDRRTGEYTAVQTDPHGTHQLEARGSHGSEAEHIVLVGEDRHQQLGTTARFRFEFRLEQRGFRHDVYLLGPDGEGVLLMESRFGPCR